MLAILIKTTFLKIFIVIFNFWKKFPFNVFNFWLIFPLKAYGKYEQGKWYKFEKNQLHGHLVLTRLKEPSPFFLDCQMLM